MFLRIIIEYSLPTNDNKKNMVFGTMYFEGVFFESKKHIDILSKEMLNKGVRIGRPFPPFYDWCRISTGTSQEVDRFVNSMLDIYS